ncbi:hypothetical protein ACFVW1_43975 [Streptomyces olivochromogenes]
MLVGRQTAGGAWLVPRSVRDPDSVEALCAAWGFEPLETYIEQVAASAW